MTRDLDASSAHRNLPAPARLAAAARLVHTHGAMPIDFLRQALSLQPGDFLGHEVFEVHHPTGDEQRGPGRATIWLTTPGNEAAGRTSLENQVKHIRKRPEGKAAWATFSARAAASVLNPSLLPDCLLVEFITEYDGT